MSFSFTEQNAPARNGNLPKPRGLLPVPPEVAAFADREEARIARDHGVAILPEAKQRIADSLTLQYYYENYTLAYRCTPQGVEVLAVGAEEIGALVKTLNQEQRLQIQIGQI